MKVILLKDVKVKEKKMILLMLVMGMLQTF